MGGILARLALGVRALFWMTLLRARNSLNARIRSDQSACSLSPFAKGPRGVRTPNPKALKPSPLEEREMERESPETPTITWCTAEGRVLLAPPSA